MDTSSQTILKYRKFLWEDEGETTLIGYEDNVFEVFETTLYLKIIKNIVNFCCHHGAWTCSSRQLLQMSLPFSFYTCHFFGFISKYYLQCVRNTFHLGVLLNTTMHSNSKTTSKKLPETWIRCIRLIYNGQEFPFFWTLGYWFWLLVNQQTESGASTTHWLTNKPVDVFSFWHVILDKYRRFCKANTRLILSPAPSHRPAACVATHWSATLTTGHHHPSLRLAKHLFMARGAATGRRLQLSQDCYSQDKVHLHKLVNVFSSFTSHMNKQQAWTCSHEDSSQRNR